jgi:hypothetical protein
MVLYFLNSSPCFVCQQCEILIYVSWGVKHLKSAKQTVKTEKCGTEQSRCTTQSSVTVTQEIHYVLMCVAMLVNREVKRVTFKS